MKIAEKLGYFCCELFFSIVNKFYIKQDPGVVMEWFLDKLYSLGAWFYSISDRKWYDRHDLFMNSDEDKIDI